MLGNGSSRSRIPEDTLFRLILLLLVLSSLLVPLAFSGTWIPADEGAGPTAARFFVAEFQWSKAFFLNLFSCLLLLVAAAWLWIQEPAIAADVKPPRMLLPALLFSGVTLLSAIPSVSLYKSFQALALVSGSLAVYGVILLCGRPLTVSRALMASLIAAAAAVALFGLLQHFQLLYLPATQYGRKNPGSFFGLTNFASEFLLIPFSISVALTATAGKRLKILYGLASFLILAYLIVAESRAAWLAIAAECLLGLILLTVWWRKRRHGLVLRHRWRLLLAIGLTAALAVLALFLTDYGRHLAAKAATTFDPQYPSNRVRLLTWQAALRMYRDHPITGVGLGNAESLFPLYASPELEFEYLGTNTKIEYVHNEYLQVLVESGTFGVLAFSVFLLSLGRLAAAILKTHAGWRPNAITIALVAGICGFLAAGVFSFPFRNPASALSFWIAVALLETHTQSLPENRGRIAALSRLLRPRVTAAVLLGLGVLFAFLAHFSGRAAVAERHFQAAKISMERKDWDEAQSRATEAIAKNPRVETYFHARALARLQTGANAAAAADLERAIALAPSFERAYMALGVARDRSGDVAGARDALLAARKLAPSRSKEILHALVPVYLTLGETDRAIEAGRGAVSLDPKSAISRYLLARAYASKRLYPQAAVECRAAIALKPGFRQARELLAQVVRGMPPRRS